jgi:hypothetical protein
MGDVGQIETSFPSRFSARVPIYSVFSHNEQEEPVDSLTRDTLGTIAFTAILAALWFLTPLILLVPLAAIR